MPSGMLERSRRPIQSAVLAALISTGCASAASAASDFSPLVSRDHWELVHADFLSGEALDQLNALHGVRMSVALTEPAQSEPAVIGIIFSGACNGEAVRRNFDLSSGAIGASITPGVVTTRYCYDWRADFDREWSGRILGTSRIELDGGRLTLHTRDGVLSFERRSP